MMHMTRKATVRKKKGIFAHFQLQTLLIKEADGLYAAYMPSLDLTTHGNSVEDALCAAQESASTFFEELCCMGTLDTVLVNLGWRKVGTKKRALALREFPYIPPEIIGTMKNPIHVRF